MTVTVSGVSHTLKTISRYLDMLGKCETLASRLCKEVGEPIIRQIHGHHAIVVSEPTENGYKITASGEDVLFIEFGAGDAAGSDNGLYDEVPESARPGSWSETHAQMYSKLGYWYFGGHKFTAVPTSPAFYYAYEAIVQALPQMAREVFGTV